MNKFDRGGLPSGVASPPDPHPLSDLAIDTAGCLERAVRKAAVSTERESKTKGVRRKLSIGASPFDCEVTIADDDHFELYAPLFTRLVVPAYADPKDAADQWCDALERFILLVPKMRQLIEVEFSTAATRSR